MTPTSPAGTRSTGPAAPLPPEPPGGWDLLVVGAGTAGLVAAQTAASVGARVLLVERYRTGGDCLWTGCVPSKALLAAAAAAADARRAARLGVHVDGVRVDFGGVMRHVRSAVEEIAPVDSPEALEAAGVRVAFGDLRFTGRRTASVGGADVHFRQAVLATGAAPTVPDVDGLAEALAAGTALTSDTVWDLDDLPRRLVVLGGGSIGCELAQAFARLGSDVSLVEAAERLLPAEDEEASDLVTAALRADGVTVLTGAAAQRVSEGAGAGGQVVLDGGAEVTFDRLLVVVGRSPRTHGLGLDAAGVDLDDRAFVVVDPALRTTNPRIWAAGDLTGHPQYTHTAGVHASTAVANALLGLRRPAQVDAMPRVTYTDPEVAAVGVSPADADSRRGWRVVTRRHTEVDRAVADGRTMGHARLVLDASGRVRGASVVGPRAGESLAEIVLAVRRGLRTRDLVASMHAYPTYADGPWNAAIDDVRARLATPVTGRAIRAAVGLRRRWLDRESDGDRPSGQPSTR